ncbi:contractile injection system tape measure protein [Pseudomonas graminis]
MNQRHKINHASLEFDFTGFADAETFELRAAQWVVQQFLPVMEAIFDEECPEQQTLVIDTLTLDLGELSAKSFYRQAPEKLKHILQATLRSQLHIARQAHQVTPSSEPRSVQVLDQQQQRWNVLWQFLSTGALPWSVSGKQPLESLGLSEMLTGHSARLINALNTTSRPEQILRRIVEQFPVGHIAALFPLLAPAQQWEIMSLLLAHPERCQGDLTDRLALAWLTRFTQLFAQHNLAPLRPDWEKLIHQFAPQLIKALYDRHTDSQLPACLVHDLTEAERLLLLSVLTPQEYPFLSAILRVPDWWQARSPAELTTRNVHATQALSPEKSVALLPATQLHPHLWLFTLQYLLNDRGSAFNRQSYMAGLVVRMANSQNQKADTLLASLIATLNSTTIDSTLRGQLLQLLHAIAPVIASPAFLNAADKQEIADTRLPATTPAGASSEQENLFSRTVPLRHINELVMALCSGEEHQLMRYWPPHSSPFAALLRWCGQLEYVRRHWCETYSDNTLFALAGVLEPLATPLIRVLIVQHRLFASQNATSTDRKTVMSLWQFTFAFLIVERGGAFDAKSYLRYLIRQMASWRNISYLHQLEALSKNVAHTGDFSLSGVTLSHLLQELAPSRLPEKSVQPDEPSPAFFRLSLSTSLIGGLSLAQLADIEDIITTLQSASQTQWNTHIHHWQRDHGKRLPLLIVSLGRSLSVLTRWVTHFDDPALFTLAAIVNSHAAETVRTVIRETGTIGAAISHASNPPDTSNTRNALWELTLHYLISRRGSEFNQYQYLLNITEQLSSRYQIGVEVFIHEWLSLSDSGFLWRQQLINLVEHHQRPPATAPQLLTAIQSDVHVLAISQQQHALLQHYAAINASAIATQLQTWNTPQLARLVHIMQPQLSERMIALLPLLLAIVHQFTLALHWFYPLLFSHQCPATPEQWLQQLLRQINRHPASPDRTHYQQLQQLVLSSNDIHQHPAERRRWLDSLLPEDALREALQQWFAGKAPAPAQGLLTGLTQHSLLPWLQRTLADPRHMQRWLEEVSAETHQAILFPTLTSAALALLALRQAFCQLFASPKQGEYLFWQTLYRQHWLKGIAMTGDRFMQDVLIELTPLWRTHTHQDKASDDASVAGLIGRLLPLISSTSQRKTLIHIASQGEQKPPAKAPWVAHLNHQQPDIKQLIETLDMTDKDVKKSAGIPWEKPQDNADVSAEPITVYNAGLVIAAPYIPMLFQKLALTDGGKFVDPQAQLQALFCLQWMTNHTNSAPEYQLLLNKVLCGVAPSTAIPQQVALPEGAETLIEGLLTAIITHWRVLGKTSINGLQTTFIQREGMLTFTPNHWQLNVIPATFDMLLAQLPWSFQTIKYPWMDIPLFVSWR